ncbi:hypothetical protein ACLB2K_055760 [Fragaria x ananassa]
MLCAISKEEFLFLVKKHYDVLIVALLFSIGVAFFVSKLAWRKATASSRGYIPGRLGLLFIGETVPFLSAVKSTGGCYEFIRLRRIRYGKWFKTRVFGKIHVFVPSTDGARMILSNDFVKFNKGYMKALLDLRMKVKIVCYLIDLMAFDSMCCMLMSITDEALLRQLEKDITAVSNAIFSAPIMIPGTKYYKGIKARRRIMEIFKDMIARRRSGEEWPEPEDFLQSLLRRDSYHPDEKLQDPEIMDNLMTLLISGQATTSATQMWSVKFLDENQQVQDILRKEVLSIARSKPEGASVTLEDINRMPYCWKVLKETMRISSVVMWYPRVALADCFEIKKGWHVNVDAKCIHNDPELYPDPSKFNPSRFDELLKPYSFIPFASGPRTCLGINMAKMTMMVFLYRLTSAYSWTVDDLDTSLQENAHFPRLRSGCPITLNPL